jgi:hypothetical protein
VDLIYASSIDKHQSQIISINKDNIPSLRFACKNEGKSPAETLKGFERGLSNSKNLRGMLSKKTASGKH